MKRILSLITFLGAVAFYSIGASAQSDINDIKVYEYGQLENALGDRWDEIDSLVVHGPVNAADINMMWKCSFEGRTTVLNLEDAQVEGNKIHDYAFFNKDVQITSSGITVVPLRRVMLPESIEEIGRFAFNRVMLEHINMPENLKKLGENCFNYCTKLSNDPLVIPEGVKTIPNECFIGCSRLKKVVLPEGLKNIGLYAFAESGVTEINLPEGLEILGEGALEATNLMNVAIPNSVKEIGSLTFLNCTFLQEISLPDHIKTIPNCFAQNCNQLHKVNIPQCTEIIEPGAFENCCRITSVNLPEGLKKIGRGALSGCSPDSIVFPSSLVYLGYMSCCDWNEIQKITSYATVPPLCGTDPSDKEKGVFFLTPTDVPLYVPAGSGELYRKAEGWKHFKNIVETTDLPSDIDNVNAEDNRYKVYAGGGGIVIESDAMDNAPVHYAVYNLKGVEVEGGMMSAKKTVCINERDIYLVRVGNETHKVRL